ncbi:DUF4873 domain-containing protein [Fodinicola acaciae]|uniref:DUF4873 domain-containing protein n=1 Tax=Fodinicola acaciae TaxID=2681555 RepID=UPI0013D5BEE0|nr:DUF4873 domain-containing protein [Fodinicola acaciae]
MTEHEHDEEGYTGPATLVSSDAELAVQVELRGYFQPIDGRYHWYGRVAADPAVTELAGNGRKQVVVRTPGGEAVGTLSDVDPWGRFRVTGTSRPPFAVETAPADA